MKIAFTSDSALNIIKLPPESAVQYMCRWWRRRGGVDGSEAHDGGRDGGSAGDRRRCMYDRTYGGIQDRSSIGEKTRVTDSPRITSGKRFFQASHFIRRLEVLRSNLSILST